MEIQAKSVFDYETMRALAHITIYKKADPQRRFLTNAIIRFVLILLILVMLSFSVRVLPDMKPLLTMLLLMEIFLMGIGFWGYFGAPRIQYASLAKMKDIVNTYVFKEDTFTNTSVSEYFHEEAEIRYDLLFQVYETSRYFFIYQSKTQVHIVDKSTIVGGTEADIRRKLAPFVGKRYFFCNY